MPARAQCPTRFTVLCPMQIERRAVARALRQAGADGVEVVQTGIGKEAVVRAVSQAGRAGGTIILAGTCGALRQVDEVPLVSRVIDEHGGAWDTGRPGGVTLIGVDRVVSTPAAKRQLAEQTGAAVVDMESHAFIAACERMGVPWGIVRGVSDTPDETLPHEVLDWITPAGDTRTWRAALGMVRRPRLIRQIVPVLQRSNRVLPRVGGEVARMIRESAAAPFVERRAVPAV